MAAEEVLKLFDIYWFKHEIFSNNTLLPLNGTNPIEEEIQESKFSHLPSLLVRSLSEQNLSSKASLASDTLSPTTPKLQIQSIVCGKVVTEFETKSEKQEDIEAPIKPKARERRSGGGRRNRGGGSNNSKSLTDLEFEELKGFMDLGFVFSEEDKDSSLVSIIPGLQRLGRISGQDEQKAERKIDKSSIVQRPYLSEAWDVLDRRKERPVLIDWRIPVLGNEMDMKDNLRFWAHTVASTVR
ncbi:hypothetical protein HS088_TW17G00082 [Tripterygium wilfordii]|uniref:DUF1685 family protein n=1 Tax=Tripterygium wilfordii TaxID=458696 RepID=A0A7J7CF37_TRIWF|nr:uncharacterized protein LOC119982695 [Tripterygium wilfordii]KAF5732555.1 hypothetical protein HS088_TW17G00082 [Tripterygium wilfordii]